MSSFTNYPLAELKLIYHLLWIQASTQKMLITSVFLQDLQDYLLAQAAAEGVEVTKPAEWAQWLTEGNSQN